MAKTYNSLSNVSVGSVLTASDYNKVLENSNNYRVPPLCRVSLSGNQSIATGTLKDLTWGTEDVDTDAMYPGSGSTITVKTPGLYLVSLNVRWSTASTSGVRSIAITRNAATDAETGVLAGSVAASVTATVVGYYSCSALVSCALNDTLKAVVIHNVGAPLNVLAETSTNFSVVWLGQVS
jgi:hypothetical protein